MSDHLLMIDNWTLQDVHHLLSEGIGHEDAVELVISQTTSVHSFQPVSKGVIHIDALLTLLTNVVLYDSLVVDGRFVETWRKADGSLSELEHTSLLRTKDFSNLSEDFVDVREAIVEELCVTPSLRVAMDYVRREWVAKGSEGGGKFLSALIWGGAGMLARSHFAEIPYFGHPARRRLLRESQMHLGSPSAVERVSRVLNEERAKMFYFRSGSLTGSVASLLLPPIAIDVIKEATSSADLVSTAISLRSRYARLREWLRHYQLAIDEENERRQISHEKTLRNAVRALKQVYRDDEEGFTKLSFSASFIGIGVNLDLPIRVPSRLSNGFGVRSTLSNLLLSPTGSGAVSKLLRMFGEEKTSLGRQVMLELTSRYSAAAKNV